MAALKARQAFRYALDRESISRTVLGGGGKATVQVAAPGTPAYDPKLDEEFGFNLTRAKDFLAQGGLAGRATKLNFLVSTSTPESPEIAQILQRDLKKLGFDVTPTIVEPSRYSPLYFKADFDLTPSLLTLATLDRTD